MRMQERGYKKSMWTVVYIAKSREIAESLRVLFEKAKLLVRIRPVCKQSDSENDSYDILVPESEVSQAHSIIIENDFIS